MIGPLINFLAPLLEPLGLIWAALLVLAVVNLAKQNRAGGAALLAVWGLITAVGSTPLPYVLVGSLERPYVGKTVAAAQAGDAVVMLGGGATFSANDMYHLGLGEASSRVFTAVEAVRKGKGRILVLGGGSFRQEGKVEPESELLRDFLTAWKACDAPILALPICQNTHDEVLGVQKLARELGWRRIVLVTSAAHQRRASALFRAIGLPVEVIACDFRAEGVRRQFRTIFPEAKGFEVLELYMHETIGWYGYKWRGWVRD